MLSPPKNKQKKTDTCPGIIGFHEGGEDWKYAHISDGLTGPGYGWYAGKGDVSTLKQLLLKLSSPQDI